MRKLIDGVESGIGTPIRNLPYGDDRLDIAQRMRRNVFTYAAFKGHKERTDVINVLKDADGKLKAWPAFRDDALKISRGYNVNWLQAEYQSAIASAQQAERWQDIERQSESLPWLTYYTQQDDKVRTSHRVLDGTTKKWDDPFWDDFYPPNGWRCRCYVLQSANGTDKDPEREPTEDETPPAFRHNPGKDGKLWSDDHPYYDTNASGNIRRQMRNTLAQEDIYDLHFQDPDTQASVEIHVTHDGVDELPKNIAFAKLMTRQGKSIQLLPHGDIPNVKWPDMRIKGSDEIIEYKDTTSTQLRTLLTRAREAEVQIKDSLYRNKDQGAIALNVTNVNSRTKRSLLWMIWKETKVSTVYFRVGDDVLRYERP